MVTTALDGTAAQHIDRIVAEVIEARDWQTAAVRLLAAADLGEVLEGRAA